MSEDWKNKDIQPYLKDKPANWSDTDNDWVAFKGNEKLEQELASIKKTQSEILERLDKPIDTQVTGSIDEYALPVKEDSIQEKEVLIKAEVLEANESTNNITMHPKGANEIYLFIQIDKQPWTLRYRNQFGSVSDENGFPIWGKSETTHGRPYPAISFPIGYNPSSQGLSAPKTMKEAKDWSIPVTNSEYFKIDNNSNEPATVTVTILRVWR